MKMLHHHLLLAGALLFSAGCIPETQWLPTGHPRSDCHSRKPPSGGSSLPDEKDTVVFMTGVKFADDYDWRKDSDYGLAEFEVVLYRDFNPCLTIPSSSGAVSPDPDTHHMIGANLYTECVSSGKTRLARDAQIIISFDGGELFKGILPDGDDIYTLSERRDGHGFSLRCNGEVLFSSESGSVFGDLADPSYRPYGALYKDEGKICFCYRDGEGLDEKYYFVIDGKAADSGRKAKYDIQDMKVSEGYPSSAELSCLWFSVSEGRVWREDDGRTILSGWMGYGGMENSSCTVSEDDPETLREICVGEALILHGARTDHALLETADSAVEIWCYDNGSALRQRVEGHRLMSASCADLLGDGLYAVLTPDAGDTHKIYCDGESREMEFHGFFSGIRVFLEPR